MNCHNHVPGVLDTCYHQNNFIRCNNWLVDAVIILVLVLRNQETEKIRKKNNNLPSITKVKNQRNWELGQTNSRPQAGPAHPCGWNTAQFMNLFLCILSHSVCTIACKIGFISLCKLHKATRRGTRLTREPGPSSLQSHIFSFHWSLV